MTRYKALISYDGHDFAGFQRQPHARSVQEEIEKTLTRINKGQPIVIHGAGRTDSGVHALGQVIHFDLPSARDEEKLRFALDTHATHYPYPLEIPLMEQAIKALEGTHDFTGFTASGTSVENKVRTITKASLVFDAQRNFLIFTFSGNGFLYKQIRNMVGTLLKIGNKRMPVNQIERILEEKDRQLAGPTAAPNGLYLKEIIYEE